MLPRSSFQRAHVRVVALASCAMVAAALVGTPIGAQARKTYQPEVTVQSLKTRTAITSNYPTRRVYSVLPRTNVSSFDLVGLTWSGEITPSTKLQVQVREFGEWSDWYTMSFDSEHGPDGDTQEASNLRQGTDPLLTNQADGVRVRAITTGSDLPTNLQVQLTGSRGTQQDRALLATQAMAISVPAFVMSPQGALVARPNIITRAQWGANESFRNEDPGIGTQIVAGFLHHTASSHNYSASQAPAQMRSLYSYYTKVRGYKDIAYNFLVDKYGNVYEGRSGCPRNQALAANCDGPAMPAIGAHTAGLNTNTFAISALGNFHTNKPTSAQAAKIVDAIAGLMAWKIAPYGVNPQSKAQLVMGNDPANKSQFNEGQLISIPSISGHRDAGKTACPGQYLYPYLPDVRAKMAQLLQPAVKNAKVSPSALLARDERPVTIGATVPANSTWKVSISDSNGTELVANEGTQTGIPGEVAFNWNHQDESGTLLPEGSYKVAITVAVGDITLPTFNSTVALASVPSKVSNLSRQRVSKTKSRIQWTAITNPASISYKYRIKSSKTGKWSKWKYTSSRASKVTLKNLTRGRTYRVQVVATNALGSSSAVTVKFQQ